ncbi:tRNA delta(2)-isopentenylpyrophosphate transferase (IPP transferase) (Isopentenyl-diphosphate:tRNA isopentenyltransferase) (IPTase) (IPPT) [Herminiimonas arsenicoxydans]|uniref:tRNA dimethylallyltransferase n=1 Tax=Herminiimonas arsenicoxydans TaxID=204773 RepID=MIAA_HERAR|nr:RecName: Full=tRNA dimethylallyltransferase; AltName: Full=Dimethylallyl diphosphate:tRNA dimethylallyltransferase; Short=DMAPP:tRNA dimethylallyltransferase; Short=DMATase; AltName: Full=Isopentenyl-diphosphate:tRNA isopentenyltransferase; Short=IPP transferase; Short=IPPT; Short=IPTase [Herminiimonas arsenicoxydans]CAL60625.1 tRNA delta(2)-isopentenylpyrophosphate transferase (IPP transferase) (Isopentenyl-diphosphate:tRNA isopentenyltransferase) (IPTase) (IPPT) [Herminiimonas arsenicoxydans]
MHMTSPSAKPLVVSIMGPTASGKTATALAIAEQIPSEIISVDSALVYREMNIGTAKPTDEERASVPHHLIDILDPLDAYSVMQFRQDALRLVAEISARGKLALLVGGTMLYFKGLKDGLDALPQADAALRAELDAEAALIGSPAMHAKLAKLDPITAARLKPNDTQRIQRALEIITLTGQPMSALLAQAPKSELPFTLLPIALEPSERSVLHARIATRFDAMLKDGGLLDEVRALRARGDLHPGLPSMRCVGYRQSWEYLDGAYGLAELREKGIAATRQLAKRQLTWLRGMPERQTIDCLAPDVAGSILRKIVSADKVPK